MMYNVIGLMSGSSLDGLDIAFVRLIEHGGSWSYEWLATDCVPYPPEWLEKLGKAHLLSVPEFLKLHTAYGHFIGHSVKSFLKEHAAGQHVDFIASHGHTVFHEPANGTTYQLCDGAAIAAETGIPVISDLRNMDVALGGQGAPIVPIGDRLLFSDYEYLLNLGGIANISIQSRGLAFDICPCNQLLNYYAQKEGKEYDCGGSMARQGKVNSDLVARLSGHAFYKQACPKSLSNDFSVNEILPQIDACHTEVTDALATCTAHIASSILEACKKYAVKNRPARLLVTGGGAFNTYLVEQISSALRELGIEVVVPGNELVQYKEALVMALIGALRWRGEENVLSTVTGAKHNSIGGAIWAGKPQLVGA